MRRGVLLVAGVAVTAMGAMVMGCRMLPLGGSVGAHEKLWGEKGSDSYQMLVKVIQGPVAMENEYRILVEKGQVVKAERRTSLTRLRPDIPFQPVGADVLSEEMVERYMVAGLFRQVRELQSLEYARFEVTVDYDATLGYPRKIVSKAKPNSGILDGYGSTEVLSLELIPKVE